MYITNRIKIPNIMKWLVIYLIITVALFFVGPLHFNIRNPGLVLLYLSLYIFFLWVGYKVGDNSRKFNPSGKYKSLLDCTNREYKLIKTIMYLGLIFNFFSVVRVAGTVNPIVIIEKAVNGLINPSAQYAQFHTDAVSGYLAGSGIFTLLLTLGLPFCIASIILSVFYYPALMRKEKIITWLLIITFVINKFISAANEGVFDTAIYIGVALFLRTLNLEVSKTERKKKSKRKRIVIILVCSVLAVLALNFFTQNIIGRTEANFRFGTLGENYYNPNAKIIKYIPDAMLITFVYLTAYLCEGYYGFSLSTTLEWVPNWGVGFSSFIRNNLSDLFNVDLFQYSYQRRIEQYYNWGALKNFHTAYLFWANDVGHIGVVLVMFVMGYVFARCYNASVFKCSKRSIILMPLLVTMVFYLPANNKVFVQPASFLLIFYILVYCCLENIIRTKRSYRI